MKIITFLQGKSKKCYNIKGITTRNTVPSARGLSQWVFSPPYAGSNPVGTRANQFCSTQNVRNDKDCV